MLLYWNRAVSQENSNFFRDLLACGRNYEFIIYSSWLEVATRYRASRLGIFWLVINPAVFVLGVGAVYAPMLGRELGPVFAHLALGYTLWRLILHVLIESAQCLKFAKGFILEGQTNILNFVLKVISKAFFNYLLALLVPIVTVALFGKTHILWMLTLILTVPTVLLNLVWICCIIAILGARRPETYELINTLLLLGFLLTPVLWRASDVPAETIAGKIVRLNPAFHMIEFVRAPALGHFPELFTLLYVAAMTIGGLCFAQWWYSRYKRFVPLWI